MSIRLDRGNEGFVTETPMEGASAERLAVARNLTFGFAPPRDARSLELLAQRRFIPAEAFAWHLRRGSLQAEIKRLCPHLLSSFETSPTKPQT